ncbi:hypothetical protein [Paraburkholderia bannensis]|uniref:hypothetical protein n=1 Tax=Paraburkholderia bannensis TaxID=765414 RepID=UPI002AAF5BFD|nr:hypothetical protein [Paraburkholderia bannensis]
MAIRAARHIAVFDGFMALLLRFLRDMRKFRAPPPDFLKPVPVRGFKDGLRSSC